MKNLHFQYEKAREIAEILGMVRINPELLSSPAILYRASGGSLRCLIPIFRKISETICELVITILFSACRIVVKSKLM